MSDPHEAVFLWPHTDATSVILTGTFDQWSSSIHLTKGLSGFEGTVKIPYEHKVEYKFIVDGQWLVHDDQPTETDHDGNVNNVYIAPKRPPMLSPEEGESTSKVAEYVAVTNGSVPTAAARMTSHVEPSAMDPDSARTLESTNGDSTSGAGAKESFQHSTYGTVAAHSSSASKEKKTDNEAFSTAFPQPVTDFADKIAYKSPVPGAQFETSGVPMEAESPTEPTTLTEKPESPREEPEVPIEEEIPAEEPKAVTEEPETTEAATEVLKIVTGEPEVSTEVDAENLKIVTEEPKIVPEGSKTVPEENKTVPEESKTITKPEVLLEEVEVLAERLDRSGEKPGGSSEESEASTKAPSALKLDFSGNAVPMSILPVDEGLNVMQKTTQAPVTPSTIDTTIPLAPPVPVHEVPSATVITSSEPEAEPEATTTAASTAPWDDETDITPTANHSSLPPAPTEVDTLPAEPSAHTPINIVSSEPEPANQATVPSTPASPEPTPQAAPPDFDPESIVAESISASSAPALTIESEPSSLADSALTVGAEISTAVQSESTVPMEEPSININIIQSEPNFVSPVLVVPTAGSLLPATRTPVPVTPTDPEPIVADDVNAVGSVHPEQVSLASAPNVSGPEPAAHILPEHEVVAADNSIVVAAMPTSASVAPDSKPKKSIELSPSNAATNGTMSTTKSVSPSKLSTPIQNQEFPSSESPGSTANSPTSSKVGTTSSRKKKSSMFGKLKHIFSKDEKEKGKS